MRKRMSGKMKGSSDVMRRMEVGDSFWIDVCGPAQRGGLFSIAKGIGIRITTRLERGGLRVWRIE
jgi:hypothetical protein